MYIHIYIYMCECIRTCVWACVSLDSASTRPPLLGNPARYPLRVLIAHARMCMRLFILYAESWQCLPLFKHAWYDLRNPEPLHSYLLRGACLSCAARLFVSPCARLLHDVSVARFLSEFRRACFINMALCLVPCDIRAGSGITTHYKHITHIDV